LLELELIGVPVILGSVDVWVLQSEDSRRVTALTVVLSEPDEDPESQQSSLTLLTFFGDVT